MSKRTGKIHYRTIDNPQLQSVLKVLCRHPKGASTRTIALEANVCAVNSIVDELRDPANGAKIDCERRKDGYWYYTLENNS